MIRSFEGARGVAALIVALFHLRSLNLFPVIAYGYLFVDLFFVLSGFLICSIYLHRLEQGQHFLPFVLRRFGRLFPLLLVSTVVFVLLHNSVALLKNEAVARGLAKFSSGIAAVPYMVPTPGELAATLTMTHALGMFDGPILNWVSWSISAEFFTYLLFACLCLLLRGRARLVVFGLLAIAGYAVTVWASLDRHDCLVQGRCFDVTYDFGFARCVSAFFLGTLTWCLSRKMTGLDVAMLARLQWFALAALALVFAFVERTPVLTFVCAPLFALLLLSLAKDTGFLATLLNHPYSQMLGQRSYSIYMMHPALLLLVGPVQKKLSGPLAGGVLALAFVAATIWVAGLTYRWIEIPWRDYFNRIAERMQGMGAGSAAERP